MEKTWKKWAAPAFAAVMLAILAAWAKGLFTPSEPLTLLQVIGILTDCFTVPGVLLAGVGLITWAASLGQFDMLGYSARQLFGHFFPSLSRDLPTEFYEYRQQKEEKGRVWLKSTFLVGVACLAVSAVLLVVYYLM